MTVGMRPSASSGRDESLRMAGNTAASASLGTAEASGAALYGAASPKRRI